MRRSNGEGEGSEDPLESCLRVSCLCEHLRALISMLLSANACTQMLHCCTYMLACMHTHIDVKRGPL